MARMKTSYGTKGKRGGCRRFAGLAFAIILVLAVISTCSAPSSQHDGSASSSSAATVVQSESSSSASETDASASTSESAGVEALAEESAAESDEADESADESTDTASIPDGWETWDASSAPEYITVVGSAVVRYDVGEGDIVYGGLDGLGRTQYAAGMLTHEVREAAKERGRQSFDASDDPSGWTGGSKASIVTPNGKTYNGAFWNRSHLVADSLGGAAARENLVCGTRMQNVGANDGRGGMAYTETKARSWLDKHTEGTLYYAATPLYVGDELIPRAVLVDMQSSDGALDEEVIVYNAAKGYAIDYNTGAFSAD